MQQLSGLDASFLHVDSHTTPMHVSVLLCYEPQPSSGNPLSRTDVEQGLQRCVSAHPILRQKVKRVAFGMDEPYWVDDQQFNLSSHIDESALPKPGHWQQLMQLVARNHARRLDLKKPLWSAQVITGLDAIEDMPIGSVALMIKVHHAAIDGVGLAHFMAELHELGGHSSSLNAQQQKVSDPNQWTLWNRAAMKNWTRPLKMANTVSRLLPALGKARDLDQPEELGSRTSAAKCRFNAEVSSKRVVGAIRIPMCELKLIRRLVRRVTYNDIAVSIVAGALREYLQQRDDLPLESLVCGAPINLRKKEDVASGNKIATMQIGMATDIDEPVERLRAVHQYALYGKARLNKLGSGTVMDISDSMTPGVLSEGLRALNMMSARVADMPVPFHVMVSNVPGPVKPIALAGNPLNTINGYGPIRHSMGLFHIVSNCDALFSISFSSCKTMLPDPEFYEQCLKSSHRALCEACEITAAS